MARLNIVADENIPFVDLLFSRLGSVYTCPGREMTPSDIVDADILLVRSVTKVNVDLLDKSKVKFVGTCTIGTDHCDIAYLKQNNIVFSSAPGCNASGVVQYVIAVLQHLDRMHVSKRVAIIGCGNVGDRLYRTLKSLGFDCVCIDPYLSTEVNADLAGFDAVYDCDVICMHTPYTETGAYPTKNLISRAELEKLKSGCLLINAGRGECIDNDALLQHLKHGASLDVALDVWAGEPAINPQLMEYVAIGTPHIAGYSFEGRVTGSLMIFQALAKYLGKSDGWVRAVLAEARSEIFGPETLLQVNDLNGAIASVYQVQNDHNALMSELDDLPESFDRLRKHYPKRREFSHYRVELQEENKTLHLALEALGFICE